MDNHLGSGRRHRASRLSLPYHSRSFRGHVSEGHSRGGRSDRAHSRRGPQGNRRSGLLAPPRPPPLLSPTARPAPASALYSPSATASTLVPRLRKTLPFPADPSGTGFRIAALVQPDQPNS